MKEKQKGSYKKKARFNAINAASSLHHMMLEDEGEFKGDREENNIVDSKVRKTLTKAKKTKYVRVDSIDKTFKPTNASGLMFIGIGLGRKPYVFPIIIHNSPISKLYVSYCSGLKAKKKKKRMKGVGWGGTGAGAGVNMAELTLITTEKNKPQDHRFVTLNAPTPSLASPIFRQWTVPPPP